MWYAILAGIIFLVLCLMFYMLVTHDSSPMTNYQLFGDEYDEDKYNGKDIYND